MMTIPWTTAAGTPPPDGILLAENDGWQLYFRKYTGGGWISLKLISKDSSAKKGNYWLVYQQGQRLGKNRDRYILEQYQPELLAWIKEQLLQQDFAGWPAEPLPV